MRSITNLKKKIKKTNKGITLIALVITIIVLLILAGVSIVTLTGEDGILSKANTAKTETNQANAKEQAQIAVYGSYDKNGKLDINELKTELGKIDKIEEITDMNGGFPVRTTIDGQGITIEQNGKVIVKGESGGSAPVAPSTDETTPFVPEGAKKIEGTIDTGLVMTDANSNEWVWIEVPKSIYTNTTYNGGTAPTSSEDYSKIESVMQSYVSEYRKSGYTDTFYSTEQHGFASSTEYNDWKNSMLKSVYENGGFYIGRYEVGIENARTADSTELPTPLIQRDKYPYNWITCNQAQTLAKQLKTGNQTSSLMFGIQWDLVIKFIEEKAGKTKNELKIDSTDWGNYKNANFTIERGEYAIINTSEGLIEEWNQANRTPKESNSSILLTTGVTNRNSVLGIYDLAGNIYEWTLEKTSDSYGSCSYRGGSGNVNSSERSAVCRLPAKESYFSYDHGCRSVLW